MKYPRYRVATCDGFPIPEGAARRRNYHTERGLSATVCDTLNLWREVKTYRSEDRVWRNGHFTTRGRDGAERDAADHAAHLNAMHSRALHTERVRGYRAELGDRG